MIRINRGMSSVNVVVVEKRLRRIGGKPFLSVVATSALTVRA
jgi:hypothetical protein